MNRFFLYLLIVILYLLLPIQVQAGGKAWVLEIKGAIGPATADYLKRGMEEAQDKGVSLIVLRMDTPGGLDIAMRDIVQSIIASSIPVVTYVAPSGARAASAGTYILYASHVAAMAPGTNLGAATPVQIGGFGVLPDESSDSDEDDKETPVDKATKSASDTMTHKMVNDAEAYLRSLAQLHGRNPEWAAEAVRESASLSAQDALEKGVIDLMAVGLPELLRKLNARQVNILGQPHRIFTSDIEIQIIEPDWRNKLLSVITNPNVAYILMLLGIYGLFFELYNPGGVLPGVIGGISLLLALFAFQVLPVNYAGIALILLGIAFMVSETFVPSFGALGIGGLIAFVIGSVILIDTDTPDYAISRPLIGGFSLVSFVFFVWTINMLVKMRTRPVVSGFEEMLGQEGQCLSNDGGKLRVYVHSEAWNAQALTDITPGQRVKVTGIDGLLLKVEAFEDSQTKTEEKIMGKTISKPV
ncbi:MAG TPA: nodulation protein NfeD [Thioploca sp.]|nr:MAG: nodulation protein NfeD [Gammaproteobacteria bacterium]HDN26499.1 nodulation protein NfeD [Thioploca sp.]